MEFSKERTVIAKGVAISLMLIHHLFAFPERLINGNYYTSLFPSLKVEFYIGEFGGICVSTFLFLSGYGMFLGYAHSKQNAFQYSLKKIKDFYYTYWTYFLIFVPIGIVFFKHVKYWNSDESRYPKNLLVFLKGLLGESFRYNSEWWFIEMFLILLILLCPFYLRLARSNFFGLFLISITIFLVALRLKIGYSDIYSVFFWQTSFAIGMICARQKFYSSRLIDFFEKSHQFLPLLGISACFLIRFRFGVKVDFLLVPLFVYFAVKFIENLRLHRTFSYLGRYSFQIWLVHSFFCYYFCQSVIYSSHYPPFIFISLLGLSLISVLVIEKIKLYFQEAISVVL